jgi:Xaa-Pro dipeptidase
MGHTLFSDDEYAQRLAAVRLAMCGLELGAALVSTPENIFYLTGLDHWGYFAPHVLIVPAEGEMVLVTRAMERVTIANQVRNARFEGHADGETAADAVLRVLRELRLAAARLGRESWSAGLPLGLAQAIEHDLPAASFLDISGLVDNIRLVKSPGEQAYLRQAARITDAMAVAAIGAIAPGARERDVAAATAAASIAAGGTYPGFGPFIRPVTRLGEEHTTWGDGRFHGGEPIFLEFSGCVARYHAPLGRLVHLGAVPSGTREMARVAEDAFAAVLAALKPGALAKEVYASWQRVVDAAGLAHYRRHHCGYVVGIGCPPSWTGGNKVTGLRHDSTLEIHIGMSFHVLSWLMGSGRGDFFLSNTVLLGENGPEVLTRTPAEIFLQ